MNEGQNIEERPEDGKSERPKEAHADGTANIESPFANEELVREMDALLSPPPEQVPQGC
jgi:hypothetical protein